MKVQRKGILLFDDILEGAKRKVAQLTPDLTNQCMNEIVIGINQGYIMLKLYESYRDNLHIANVMDMLKQMEEIYKESRL